MNEKIQCHKCGKQVPNESPRTTCPACLMAQAMASRTLVTGHPDATLPPPPSPEEIADKFPQYEILECLGRGGMGVVYKARQKSLDRWVAIKVLAPERVHQERFAEHFEREAKTLAKMNHPNIVTVFDHGKTDDLFYIIMEFVDGVNLRDLLREGKIEPEQALVIVPPICDALQYAHDKGIVHRDIKPENLLLDREGRVKIADFGIASLVGATGEKSGTPPYMAPEQSGGTVDRRADIYALGVVLYEMLTGERPEKDLVAPSQRVEVSVKIDEMVLRALEKEPERRYQSAGEFRTMVETIASPEKTSDKWQKKSLHTEPGHRALNGVVLACGVMSALILTLFYWLKQWVAPTLSLESQRFMLFLTLVCALLACTVGWLIRKRWTSSGKHGTAWGAISLTIGMLLFIAGHFSEKRPQNGHGTQAVASAEPSLAVYDWLKQNGQGEIKDGVVEKMDGRTVLKIQNLQDEPQLARLLTILAPPIKTTRYAIKGEVRYENVEGVAYLEMWNEFPKGRFFSRTAEKPGSGPMAQLTGTSDWRPFLLPFDQTGSATPPNRIELNLHLPGRGVVFVGPLELIELGTEPVSQASTSEQKIGESLPLEIIDRQNEFVKIMAQIESKHPDIYVGAEVGDVCKIYLKGKAPQEVTALVQKSDLVIEVVDQLPYSMRELEEKRDQAVALVSKAGYTHEGSAIDLPHEILIQLGLKEGLPSEEKEIMKLFPENLAKIIRVETIGGKEEAPGMVGYVVAVDPDKQSFLLTRYEPEAGLSACNNATWFHQPDSDVKLGQKVKVWFSGALESYPAQASAIRTEVEDGDLADPMAHAIRLALEKRKQKQAAGIPYLVSIEHDKPNKQWKVLFASDANKGKVDPEAILVADEE